MLAKMLAKQLLFVWSKILSKQTDERRITWIPSELKHVNKILVSDIIKSVKAGIRNVSGSAAECWFAFCVSDSNEAIWSRLRGQGVC